MRHVFSEIHKRTLLRTIWIAIAKAQMKAGLVTIEQVEESSSHKDEIDIKRASEIEKRFIMI